ncbi:MAG TPA: pyruvate dehydrogenase complex E1 component subunit beta [Candidatus Dormibacteraeota bacterium]|nr:pyruvate dehydrogenase complex E1 component subunit beta [Candidatus Dormibacteraeota bacterium]
MRELTLLEAIREALAEEMARDPRVLVFGEDVGRLGGVFRATEGLLDRFGPDRVVDMPMSEAAIAGLGVGLAMRGLRPVAEIQFADFIHAAFDQIAGEAARVRYRSAGDWSCPLVVRTAYGGGFRGGPYHSQSVEAFYSHVPGLKVVAPSFPADAKGLLTAAIRDPDPVLFLEHKLTYRQVKGPVPEGEHQEEIGRARVVRPGDSLTICAYGMMLHRSLEAAQELAAEGIEAEVLDLRTLLPLDRDAILASVRRTGRLCVVHEDTLTMGLGAEVAALVCEAAMDELKAAPVRVAMADIAGIPVSDPQEDAAIPDRARIAAAARGLAGRDGGRRTRATAAFDAAIPAAASVVEVALPEQHLERLLTAVVEACSAFPACNAEFTWEGIRQHPQVRIDLDLGPHSPARGDGTFTVVDYGAGSSLLGVPAVRPGQTAALRVGGSRGGRAWLALSVDHRAVDGAEAGRFLRRLKELLEG